MTEKTSRRISSRRKYITALGTGMVTGLAGCTGAISGGSQSSNTSGPITVGALVPLNYQQGKDMRDGIKLAVDRLNSNGGVNGRNLKVAVRDSKADPATAKKAYTQLIQSDNADFTTGVFSGDVMLNLLDSIAQQKKIHFTNGAATNDLEPRIRNNYDKYKYHFRTVQDSRSGAKNRAAFMKKQFSGHKVAIIYEDYKWTKPFQDVWGSMTDSFDIVYQTRFSGDTKDYSPIYDKVEKAGAEDLFVAMAFVGTKALVQWARQKRPFTFGGNHNYMQSSDYWSKTNGLTQYGWTNTAYLPGIYFNDATKRFLKNYHSKYSRTPTYTGATAYEAIEVWAKAANKLGTIKEDKMIPQLEKESIPSVLGDIGFYGKGNHKVHDLVYEKGKTWDLILQWQKSNNGGSQESVFYDPYTKSSFQKPNWV